MRLKLVLPFHTSSLVPNMLAALFSVLPFPLRAPLGASRSGHTVCSKTLSISNETMIALPADAADRRHGSKIMAVPRGAFQASQPYLLDPLAV